MNVNARSIFIPLLSLALAAPSVLGMLICTGEDGHSSVISAGQHDCCQEGGQRGAEEDAGGDGADTPCVDIPVPADGGITSPSLRYEGASACILQHSLFLSPVLMHKAAMWRPLLGADPPWIAQPLLHMRTVVLQV